MPEEPALERLQQLAARERLHPLQAAVPLGHAEVVLQRTVCSLQRVVEFVALEHVVVTPRLVARAMLWVDRTTDSPKRTLLTLDPDEDGLLGARVVDAVNDTVGEAAFR